MSGWRLTVSLCQLFLAVACAFTAGLMFGTDRRDLSLMGWINLVGAAWNALTVVVKLAGILK